MFINCSNTNNELDIFDLSPSTSTSPASGPKPTTVTTTISAGQQFDNLAASVCFDSGEPSADLLEFDTSKDVDGLGGISLRLVGSEDVDLVGTSFSLALNESGSGIPSPPKLCEAISEIQMPLSRKRSYLNPDPQSGTRKKHRISVASSSVIVREKPTTVLTPQMIEERQDVERICLDLVKRFQIACAMHPKTHAKVWMARSSGMVINRNFSLDITNNRGFR